MAIQDKTDKVEVSANQDQEDLQVHQDLQETREDLVTMEIQGHLVADNTIRLDLQVHRDLLVRLDLLGRMPDTRDHLKMDLPDLQDLLVMMEGLETLELLEAEELMANLELMLPTVHVHLG